MYRKHVTDFRMRLKFDRIDRKSRFAFLTGDVVEVDLVGDPPGPYAVQEPVIAGTDLYLDHKDAEMTRDEPTAGILSAGREGDYHDTVYWIKEKHKQA